ncbi:MAG: methyltransferase domain-containing protein [Planctomycetota bacterium]|nr:MAG: methyltransferase domain-containing protein [Planctomycetota bacterium]
MNQVPPWLMEVLEQLPSEQVCRAILQQSHDDGAAAPETPAVGVEDGATWPYLWPGGLRLAADLPFLLQDRPLPRNTLDLGCGRGILGFAAVHLGCKRVTCVDGDSRAVHVVSQAAEQRGLQQLNAIHHTWEHTPLTGGPFALILGGDILYRPQYHQHLMETIALHLSDDGEAWLADPRQVVEPQLPIIAAECGLQWSHHIRPGPYSLCRLSWP